MRRNRKVYQVSTALEPSGQQSGLNLWSPQGDNYEWTSTKVDISDIKKARGIGPKSKGSFLATIGVLGAGFLYWFLFVTECFGPIWNIGGYITVNIGVALLIWFKIEDIGEVPSYEKFFLTFQYISILVISLLLTDLLFEVFWFASLFNPSNIYVTLILTMLTILSIILVNCFVYLWAARKRNIQLPAGMSWRDYKAQGMPFGIAVRKKTVTGARLLARNITIILIVMCSVTIYWLIQQIYILAEVLETTPEGTPDERIGFADATYYAFFEAQYGGAGAFTSLFEMLIYNPTSTIMLGLMVIGTFANIFVINQTKSSALQSATTLTVVGIPMLIVASIFVGVIPPPSVFVRLFGSEAISSFVYAFAEVSVFIIYLSLMMVFSHAAEVFQPGEGD